MSSELSFARDKLCDAVKALEDAIATRTAGPEGRALAGAALESVNAKETADPEALALDEAALEDAITKEPTDFEARTAVIAAIKRFVSMLSPDHRAELERRARLIECACKKGGGWDKAQQAALANYTAQLQERCPTSLALLRLRTGAKNTPLLIGDLANIVKAIDRVLQSPPDGFTTGAKEAFQRWRDLSDDICWKAQELCADGCRFIHHVGCLGDSMERAMLGYPLGVEYLPSIRDAAHALRACLKRGCLRQVAWHGRRRLSIRWIMLM